MKMKIADDVMRRYEADPVHVKLGDGNAFAILAACQQAWRRSGRPMHDWVEIRTEAMSSDYDHVLQTVIRFFSVTL
jgi:hypothetical protein